MKKKILLLSGLCAVPATSLFATQIINTTPRNNQAEFTAPAGQTFRTGTLGPDTKLVSIAVAGPSTNASATVQTLKIWIDGDNDASTWDPGALVATSTNSSPLNGNVNNVFNFSGEELSDNTVYVLSFNDGTVDHAAFRAGLTNAAGSVIEGGLFMTPAPTEENPNPATAQIFNAFDLSFIVNANDGSAPRELAWTGGVNGNWDVSTNNWKLPDNSPALYTNNSSVVFDDTASTGTVELVGSIQPLSVEFNNSTLPYSLSGVALGGPSSLTKDGTGSLTLTQENTYSGGTNLVGGSIIAGDGATSGQIGAGPVTIDADTTLTISRSDLLDYKAVDKMRIVSGEGNVVLDGGGVLFNYPGGGTDFTATGTWSGFSGNLVIKNGSEFQTIRNGASAMGTGTVILGDATSSGNLSQIEGNWTWTNPISVVGPQNSIVNRSAAVAGVGRSQKLQGPISGDGFLSFKDATTAFTDPDLGFIITSDVTLTNPVTIDAGVPVRIGGVPGNVNTFGAGRNADNAGSLGSTGVINNGFVTFSRLDTHTVDSVISGPGAVRIGLPSVVNFGDTSLQAVTFANSQTYTGTTTINNGRLVIPDGVQLASPLIDVLGGALAGSGTVKDVNLFAIVSPGIGAGTGTLNADTVTVHDNAVYQVDVAAWGTPVSDLISADLIDFQTTGAGLTITLFADSLTDFTESNKTIVIASGANGITNFDASSITINSSNFASATGSAGTWAAQTSGNNLELVYTLGVSSDFDTWASGFSPIDVSNKAEDTDNDGLTNEEEYAFGLDPTDSSSLNPISSLLDKSTGIFSYTRRDPALSSLTYRIEFSTTLADGEWTTVVPAVADQVVTNGENQTVTVDLTGAPGNPLANEKLFIRVVAN